MMKTTLKSSALPFHISDLPEGVSVSSSGLQVAARACGTVVLRLEGEMGKSEIEFNVSAGANSHLKIVLFQNISSSDDLALRIRCKLETSARIDFIQFHLGGASVNVDLIQEAAGAQAELNADLLSRTRGSQKHQFNVSNIYPTREGRGKMLLKGVALDESNLTLNGAIQIGPKGGGTHAYLKQDSLLLSKKASIKATPGLNIETNDVKAAHGASVTNLDLERLFYFTSRGISKAEAKKMMMQGFMAEQLDKINDLPELREHIQTLI